MVLWQVEQFAAANGAPATGAQDCSSVPGGQVTTRIAAIIGLNRQSVVAVDVTIRARGHFTCWGHLVGIRQRETGGAVIKFAVGPGGDGVASRASGGGVGKFEAT